MPLQRAPTPVRRVPGHRGVRRAAIAAGVLVAAAVALLAAAFVWSGASLEPDATALAVVAVQPFGGSVRGVRAVGSDGHAIPLDVAGGRLTPRRRVAPGERIAVTVTVRRPGWDAWLLGRTRTERLTVRAPVAHVTERWVTARSGAPVRVRFSEPVAAVADDAGGAMHRRRADGRSSVAVHTSAPAGTLRIAAAARSWEKLGPPATVHWFPRTREPVAVVSPAPGGRLAPGAAIRLVFSRPVADVLGSARPKLSDGAQGHWRRADSHTLVFEPSGFGVAFGSDVRLTLPRTVAVATASGHGLRATREIGWTVPPASTLRLHQLLAQAGYLPVSWKPSGAPVPTTRRAEVDAAIDPPAGSFSWRYPNTPPELKSQWQADRQSEITRGAVMMFQDEHHLTVDAVAGPSFWRALIDDAIAGRRHQGGYSYVYVHRNVPQLLTLWHDGHTVLTSPGNTGVPAAPTQLGTFPVFEHIPVTTMSGTNPDGSHYSDPGIKWVSYFNGGDALHAFNRASFGTPQSLGCVELPEAAAAKVYPYTPIGTLVTIEN